MAEGRQAGGQCHAALMGQAEDLLRGEGGCRCGCACVGLDSKLARQANPPRCKPLNTHLQSCTGCQVLQVCGFKQQRLTSPSCCEAGVKQQLSEARQGCDVGQHTAVAGW